MHRQSGELCQGNSVILSGNTKETAERLRSLFFVFGIHESLSYIPDARQAFPCVSFFHFPKVYSTYLYRMNALSHTKQAFPFAFSLLSKRDGKFFCDLPLRQVMRKEFEKELGILYAARSFSTMLL